MSLSRLAVLGKDPEYLRIRENLKGKPGESLEEIVNRLSSVISKRQRKESIVYGTAAALPILGLIGVVGLNVIGLKEIADNIMNGTIYTILGEAIPIFSYMVYSVSGKRREDYYNSIAAEVLLGEKRDSLQKCRL